MYCAKYVKIIVSNGCACFHTDTKQDGLTELCDSSSSSNSGFSGSEVQECKKTKRRLMTTVSIQWILIITVKIIIIIIKQNTEFDDVF